MNIAEFFFGSIPLLLQFYAEMYRETDFKNTMLELESEFNVPKFKTFDFIVVGAGTAGCVLAGRLSEHFNVLLLEAGGPPPPATTVPYFTPAVTADPSINYFFKSVPQTNAVLCCDGIAEVHTGRMLGGSGSHNDNAHSRGSPKDYDNWAYLLNDESFNYSNVLKYFKRMETFVGQKLGADGDEYYGHDGPITVNTTVTSYFDLWQEAGVELGYNITDPNGYQREGFAPINVATRNGRRSSSYVEYIKPYTESRKTLTVIPYANVSEILLDDENKAYGIAYTRHGIPQIAHAQKEIILSAGAISSPLLLIKSGIGPESILNAAEIPIKVPLEAVGKNLGEHPSFIFSGFSVTNASVFDRIDSSETEKILRDYHSGEGILTITTQAQCFIVTPRAEPNWPNLWIKIHPFISIDSDVQRIHFYNVVGRPQSKGFLTLDTEKYKAGIRDDVQLALIDYKFLSHPDDVEAMLFGVKFILKIIETEAFKSINLTYTTGPDPACDDFTFLTDDYWKCKIQRDTHPWNHLVGTCSLGPDSGDATTSVVDTKFRVRGVSSLRVVDASVIPQVTNANINAPILMLAEKASEDIITLYNGIDTIVPTTASTTNKIETTSLPSGSGTESTLFNSTKLLLVFSLIFIFHLNYCKNKA